MRNIAEIIKDDRNGKKLSQTERQIAVAYAQGKYDAVRELKIGNSSNTNEVLDKIRAEIVKLQTYKLFEDEEAVYVDRNDVLELLEQEPCEDCISREAVLALSDYVGETPTYSNPYAKLEEVVRVEDIKSLPSVQPKIKTGHWIYDGDQIICSRCHTAFGFISLKLVTDFCAKCGADMRESQESEKV